MKSLKHLLAAASLLVALPSVAGTYEWTTSFAMGVTQYQVDDGNSIDLWVACPTDRGISAGLTVDGTHISSEQQPGFDLLVDGSCIAIRSSLTAVSAMPTSGRPSGTLSVRPTSSKLSWEIA
ncbi:hypothetical protein UMZ34_16925 [Halopseudomonas pachastrellae]|nr:hypothetical protein UMZ34_16925 [Halopseudomonas pachastrellae]